MSTADYTPTNGTAYRLKELERRVGEVEKELDGMDTKVLAVEIRNLKERVDFLIKLLGTTFGSLILLCFTFLWATAQGWIGG